MLTCLTCLHSRRATDDELPYPHLRTLLQFNTQVKTFFFLVSDEKSRANEKATILFKRHPKKTQSNLTLIKTHQQLWFPRYLALMK